MAFRTEASVIAIMLPIGIWMGKTAVEWALLIGSCMLVLITELLNSAVENVVDRIGAERHILSKQAKDLGSAAAAVSMLTAVIVWGLIAYERFIH
jgi:diacylglycerol kinase (ATP)